MDRWVSRTDPAPDDQEPRFFKTRPIAADGATLDFASIPVAAWELRVEIPGGGRKRKPFTALKPGGVTDLGDFVIPDLGSVRLTLEFPVELPHGEVTVRVQGLSSTTGAWTSTRLEDDSPEGRDRRRIRADRAGPRLDRVRGGRPAGSATPRRSSVDPGEDRANFDSSSSR